MKQFTIVIEVNDKNKYAFKNFTDPKEIIAYIANLSKGPNKVYNIFSTDECGNVQCYTVGFISGMVQLVETELPIFILDKQHQEKELF